MLKNTKKSYGTVTKIFHWVMGIIIIIQICVGYIMANLPDTAPQKGTMIYYHKSTGVLLLILIILRLLWRMNELTPPLPSSMPHWQAVAARWNINLLLIMMLVMPLSGLFMSILGGYPVKFYGFFTIPSLLKNKTAGTLLFQTHVIGGYIISASVILHILASLYHHLIRHDTVLKRIIVNVD
jgi:cytochrome b561